METGRSPDAGLSAIDLTARRAAAAMREIERREGTGSGARQKQRCGAQASSASPRAAEETRGSSEASGIDTEDAGSRQIRSTAMRQSMNDNQRSWMHSGSGTTVLLVLGNTGDVFWIRFAGNLDSLLG